MATREELRAEGGRAGLSNAQLDEQVRLGNLTAKEAASTKQGFTGSFGEGNAEAFRNERGIEVSDTGVVTSPKAINQVVADNISNPTLAQGATLTPVLQEVQGNELQTTPQLGTTPTVANPNQVTPEQVGTATVDEQAAVSGVQENLVEAQMTQAVAEGEAAKGIVNELATVQGQLAGLYADVETGEVPQWALAAHSQATQEMSAKGLNASSISAGAITAAYMASALPIAAQDASTYFQMDMANLNNEQQMELTNLQNRQQNMLTDTAIANASEQFNATSASQTQQFMASLITSIQSQNADRINATSQFNAASKLQADTFNVQTQVAVDEFNASMDNQRQQFNAQMQFAVDQSNVTWRRGVNTANTAAVNAANQVNTQNAYNLSTSSLNAIWQQWRDEATWAVESAATADLMEFNLAMAAGNRDYLASIGEQNSNVMDLLGSFAVNWAFS